MSRQLYERLGIPDRKPTSRQDFEMNFLQPLVRDNKVKGDGKWIYYGERGVIKDVLSDYQLALAPILNNRSLQDLADVKNENGKNVAVEFFGPGDIFKYLHTDLSVALTLENLHSPVERLYFWWKNIRVLGRDINDPESLGRSVPKKLKGNLATLGIMIPGGGYGGVPQGHSVWHFQHDYLLLNGMYQTISFNNGAFLSDINIPDTEIPIISRWIKKTNIVKDLHVTLEKPIKGYSWDGVSEWCLRIDKGPTAPQDLPLLF